MAVYWIGIKQKLVKLVLLALKILAIFRLHKFTSTLKKKDSRQKLLELIKELAGCDLLTIAPKFLEELKKEKGELIRKLDVSTPKNNSIEYEFEEKDFRLSMLEDQMASEKLSEGITGFSKAIEELEELLLKSCLLYTSPSPRDSIRSRMPSSA